MLTLAKTAWFRIADRTIMLNVPQSGKPSGAKSSFYIM